MGPIPHSKERILVKIKFECRPVLMSKHHDSLLLWYFTGRHWTDSVFVWTCILYFIYIIYAKKDDRAMRPIYECPENFREFLTRTMPSAHGYFFRSFTRSCGGCGYPKNLGSPWIRPRSLFSEISKFLMDFCSDVPCKCSSQIWGP